jgi:hypothetical protein
LVTQGKHLEQQISTRRPSRSEAASVLATVCIACRVPTGDANVNEFLTRCNIGEAQAELPIVRRIAVKELAELCMANR